MKKNYYLLMLCVVPLIVVFDSIYFAFHKSWQIFLSLGLIHLVLYGVVNLPGIYLLYKPIDTLFSTGGSTEKAKIRIQRLSWHSGGWVFALGVIFNVIATLPFFLAPTMYGSTEAFSVEKMPPLFILSGLPATLYINAILPAFITFLLINDYKFELKKQVFTRFNIEFTTGHKKIAMTLIMVFFILVFFPAMLVILELTVALEIGEKYAQFSTLGPLETVLIDRLVVFVGMIISVIFLTRSFTKPLHALLSEFNKVRTGDYSTKAAIIADDEIGELTKEFNAMMHTLEISHNQLEESNRTLEKKVEERTHEIKQKNTELEATLEKLKQMQKKIILQEKMASLGSLVAGVTHEINTPLGAIRSMKNTQSKAIEKLQSVLRQLEPENNRDLKNALEVIVKADQVIDQGTERLNEIMHNLKKFARLDEAETATADIHEGIDSVLNLIKHDMLASIEVVREYGTIPLFTFQPRKLNQVFLNLIKNACHAMEQGGRLTITTHLHENQVHVAIRDTGKGLSSDEMKTIFDPGFTSKDTTIRADLGLSISYQIVQEHHGEIRVESQIGEGSEFTVVIPLNGGA